MCIACINKPVEMFDDHMAVKRFLKRMKAEELAQHAATLLKETLQTLDESGAANCEIGREQIGRLREQQYVLARQL